MGEEHGRPRPEWAKRLQAEREARGWGKRKTARELYTAAGIRDGNVTSLAKQVAWHEEGRHFPRDWAPAYAVVFETDEADLFHLARGTDPSQALPLLLAGPPRGATVTGDAARLPAVENVEALLRRLYRLEAEFGGNELCAVVRDQVDNASALFGASSLSAQLERRLYTALAGLTQIAGWLCIDANRHADANRHLAATVYAAHETDDLALAAHAMGYMSVHAFYRDEPRRALTLATTASMLAQATGSPRTRAILHDRVARAHARLGDSDECRRHLELAEVEHARAPADEEPQWTTYVNDVEIAAQRGACLLDLQLGGPAVDALRMAIALAQTRTPDHHRDLAHYKTRLAAAHVLQGEPEQAASVAAEAHDLAAQIGSARVSDRFDDLIAKLEPFDVPEVHDLMAKVRDQPGR
ncbi:hypothetical protein [Actinomadura sp. 9N407]|uniref:hypothetical protein n=1 Tax=Actinomadura sp. 9N407 TaxID=3375154 RepID=UPI0037A3FB7A